MKMYAELTPETAQKKNSEFLVAACNECRPESGAYLVAKNELAYRASRRALWQKLMFTSIGIALGVIGILVKQWLYG